MWTSLFGEYFMQLGDEKEISTGHEEDDMLFYVRCNLKTSYSEVCSLCIFELTVPLRVTIKSTLAGRMGLGVTMAKLVWIL